MRIAVAGGSGTAGRYAIEAAEKAGHEVVALSHGTGVNVATGAGLSAALEGVGVIIDAANPDSQKRDKATAFFVETARHLQQAGAQHGVSRLVVLSIVGLERVPYGYYQAKLAQEAAAGEGPLPVSIVRSTQFHEFPGQILLRTRLGPFALAPRMVVQPIAARTVGEIVVEMATRPELLPRLDIAGPNREYLPDMAQAILHRQGKRGVVLPFSMRGDVREGFQGGGVLPGDDARVAGPSFDDWLDGTDALTIKR